MDFIRTLLVESPKNLMLLLAIAVPFGLTMLLNDAIDNEVTVRWVVAGAVAYGLFFWVAAIWYECRLAKLRKKIDVLQQQVDLLSTAHFSFLPEQSFQVLPHRSARRSQDGILHFDLTLSNWSAVDVTVDKLRMSVRNLKDGTRSDTLGEALDNKSRRIPSRSSSHVSFDSALSGRRSPEETVYVHGEARLQLEDGRFVEVPFETAEIPMFVSS